MGDLSLLAPSTECPEGHNFNNNVPGYCIAYGRDRGEAGVAATEYDSYDEFVAGDLQRYTYVFTEGADNWVSINR